MNLIKTTLPSLLIAIAAILVYVYFVQITPAVQQALPLLPYLLVGSALLLALYFNSGHLFYLSLISFAFWFVMSTTQLPNTLAMDMFYLASLILILVFALVTEKGLLTFAAWPSHITTIMITGLAYGLWVRQPINLNVWLYPTWLPESWLSWSVLGQLSWLLLAVVFAVLFTVFIWRQSHTAFNGLLALLAVTLMIHWNNNKLAMILCCSAGLLAMIFSALQKSWHLAYVDELTALPGRRALEERLQRSLGIYALAMLDVDHFKKFNDTYGHDVGDDVLRMIATKIGKIGGGGKAYRYGGEEFTVVFNNHSADEIKAHLQDLIEDIASTPFVVNRRKQQKPKTVKVTISIGVTDSIHKANATETIKVADQALYQAKKKGRNRLQIKT